MASPAAVLNCSTLPLNRGRSRVKDLSNWKCQTQKRLRDSELAYVSRSGMVQKQKNDEAWMWPKMSAKVPWSHITRTT